MKGIKLCSTELEFFQNLESIRSIRLHLSNVLENYYICRAICRTVCSFTFPVLALDSAP